MSRTIVYLAGISASLALLSGGTLFGWTSPAFSVYNNKNGPSPMELTDTQKSWITSLLSWSGALGSALSVFSINNLGRKFTMLAWVIPTIITWLMISVATEPELLYVSRFVSGIALAAWFCATPQYLSEIAPADIRGFLLTGAQTAAKLGILIEYSFGPFVSVAHGAYISLMFPLLFGLTFIWMPASPYYLIRRGRRDEAEKSLRRLRGKKDVSEDLEIIEKSVNAAVANNTGFRELLGVYGNRKALIISLTLVVIQQFTGNQAIIAYAQEIFDTSGSLIPGVYLTITLGALSVVTTLVNSLIVDKSGRRPLLLFSTIGSGITLTLLALYFYLARVVTIPSYLRMFPAIGILLYSILYAGLGALPYTIMAEIFPSSVKALGCSIAIVVVSGSCAFITFLHKTITGHFTDSNDGLFVAFSFYALSSGLGAIFIYYCVPETRKKSLQEIQNELHGTVKK